MLNLNILGTIKPYKNITPYMHFLNNLGESIVFLGIKGFKWLKEIKGL